MQPNCQTEKDTIPTGSLTNLSCLPGHSCRAWETKVKSTQNTVLSTARSHAAYSRCDRIRPFASNTSEQDQPDLENESYKEELDWKDVRLTWGDVRVRSAIIAWGANMFGCLWDSVDDSDVHLLKIFRPPLQCHCPGSKPRKAIHKSVNWPCIDALNLSIC